MTKLPLRMALRVPVIATGTIGACPLMRHDEAALLERQQRAGAAARSFGEDQERVAGRERGGSRVDRWQALLGVAALERNEAGQVPRLHQDRQLAQLGLVEDPQLRVECRAAP